MSFAHLTLPTQDVEKTATFLEQAFGYPRNPIPANSPIEVVWLNIGRGQELHVIHVDGYETSPFEAEFGRHVALFHPLDDFVDLKARLTARGAVFVEPLRTTPYERFFFREPINGYLFEVIDADRLAALTHRA